MNHFPENVNTETNRAFKKKKDVLFANVCNPKSVDVALIRVDMEMYITPKSSILMSCVSCELS